MFHCSGRVVLGSHWWTYEPRIRLVYLTLLVLAPSFGLFKSLLRASYMNQNLLIMKVKARIRDVKGPPVYDEEGQVNKSFKGLIHPPVQVHSGKKCRDDF